MIIGYGCAPSPSQPVTPSQPATSVQPVTPTQSDVPDFIKSRFGAIYPGAEDIVWTTLDRSYEVAFNFKQTQFKILFLEDGSVERTKTKAEISTLPEGITNYAKGSNITEALRVMDGFGTVTWEVRIGDQKYLFNQSGAFLGRLL